MQTRPLWSLWLFGLIICSKQYNKKFVFHLIVVPQLSCGRQHNYSTKTRQAGRANEQFSYVYGTTIGSFTPRKCLHYLTWWWTQIGSFIFVPRRPKGQVKKKGVSLCGTEPLIARTSDWVLMWTVVYCGCYLKHAIYGRKIRLDREHLLKGKA